MSSDYSRAELRHCYVRYRPWIVLNHLANVIDLNELLAVVNGVSADLERHEIHVHARIIRRMNEWRVFDSEEIARKSFPGIVMMPIMDDTRQLYQLQQVAFGSGHIFYRPLHRNGIIISKPNPNELPHTVQHKVLTNVKDMLEQVCHTFVRQFIPEGFQNYCDYALDYHSLELLDYHRIFRHPIAPRKLDFYGREPHRPVTPAIRVNQLMNSVIQIGRRADHRTVSTVKELMDLLQQASELTWILKSPENTDYINIVWLVLRKFSRVGDGDRSGPEDRSAYLRVDMEINQIEAERNEQAIAEYTDYDGNFREHNGVAARMVPPVGLVVPRIESPASADSPDLVVADDGSPISRLVEGVGAGAYVVPVPGALPGPPAGRQPNPDAGTAQNPIVLEDWSSDLEEDGSSDLEKVALEDWLPSVKREIEEDRPLKRKRTDA